MDFKHLRHKLFYFLWFVALPLVVSWVTVDLLARARVVDEFEVWYVLLLFAILVMLIYSIRDHLPLWRDRDPNSLYNRRRRARNADRMERKVRKLLRRKSHRVTDKGRREVESALEALAERLQNGDDDRISSASRRLEEKVDRHMAFSRKSASREYVESIGVAVIIAVVLRLFVVEAFKIPSESMVPTLMVGDHIFVSKYLYGISIPFTNRRLVRFADPDYGDVVVFAKPSFAEQHAEMHSIPDFGDESELVGKDFIKRIVGLPGDEVELCDDVLVVNGEPVPRCPLGEISYRSRSISGRWSDHAGELWVERHGERLYTIVEESAGPVTSWGPRTVPEDQVFVLGDNRDNSNDSRFWGTVPVDNIKGRAMIIWWSNRRPHGFQWDRVGKLVMSEPDLDPEQERMLASCPAEVRSPR